MQPIHNPAPGLSGKWGSWTVYLQRNVYTPAIGRALALRTLFEDRIRTRQATGIRTGLNTRLGGNGPRLTVSIVHEDLAAFEAFRDGLATEPGYAEFGEQVEAHLGAHAETTLSRIILPLAPRDSWGRYVVRASCKPLLGAGPELLEVLTDRVRLRQSEDRPAALVAGVIGTDVITQIVGFRSLSEVEELSERVRDDSVYQAYQSRLRSLVSAMDLELHEVLIPMGVASERELVGSASR